MFDVVQLQAYIAPMILGVCLCVGYIIKKSFNKIDNKYIPAIMGVLGVILSIWTSSAFTVEVILTGLISGLASTGLHQIFAQLINKSEDKDEK